MFQVQFGPKWDRFCTAPRIGFKKSLSVSASTGDDELTSDPASGYESDSKSAWEIGRCVPFTVPDNSHALRAVFAHHPNR